MQYCNWGGSSAGIRAMLKNGDINRIGLSKPYIFMDILRRSGHPTLNFHYNNGKSQEVSVANMSAAEVEAKINEYSERSGAALFRFNHKVMSINDSVRGIWSPMQIPKSHRYKI